MHTIHRHQVHYGWDRDEEPVLVTGPGDTISLELRDASDGQIASETDTAALLDYDGARSNPLTGPIVVEGAEPGDALLVEILGLDSDTWGWTGVLPGFGLLSDAFPDAHLRHSRIREGSIDVDGIARVPHRPFLGTVGVAPAAPGRHDVIPPRRTGGNLDLVDVEPGATLILPVEVPGALLSVGDGHGAQGDGEVCGTAVETPTAATVRLELLRGQAPAMPMVQAANRRRPLSGRAWTTTGVAPDLMQASRDAVAAMVDVLFSEGLDPVDAYLLCSIAGDLRIGEVVDLPNVVVAMTFPLDVID